MIELRRKAYSYIRFSTPEQKLGDSLRRQVAAAEAWCRNAGLVLDSTLRDEGVSGFRRRNATVGALAIFLAAIRNGEVGPGSALIVESLDRLSRAEPLDALDLLRDIIRAGVEVVTLHDGQRYSTASMREIGPLLQALVIMSRAHEESHTKAKRLAESWNSKRSIATDKQRPMTRQTPAWIQVEGVGTFGVRNDWSAARFAVIPDRAKIVREIFEWHVDGMGRRRIAAELNRHGVPVWGRGRRKAKGGWQESYISKILKNRAVLGEFQPHRFEDGRYSRRLPAGDPIPGYYPAVVKSELWHAARARDRQVTGTRGRPCRTTLLAGFVKDPFGAPMHIENKGEANFFATAHAYRRDNRPTYRWRVDHLEQAVLMVVREIDWGRVFLSSAREHDVRRFNAEIAQCDEQIEVLKAKLKSAASRLLEPDFAHFRDEIRAATAELKEEEAMLRKRRLNWQSQLDQIMAELSARSSGAAPLIAATNSLQEPWAFERARAELKRLVRRITVYPDGAVSGFPVEQIRSRAAELLKAKQGLLARKTGQLCGAIVIEYINGQTLTVFVTYRRCARTSKDPKILFASGVGYEANGAAAIRDLKVGRMALTSAARDGSTRHRV